MTLKNLFPLACAFVLSCPLPSAGAETPPADAILATLRHFMVNQGEWDVVGSLRKGGTKIPFSLSSRGATMIYQYKPGDTWLRFDVRMDADSAKLFLVKPGNKAEQLLPAHYGQHLTGTDVSYEDLAMSVLYWQGGRVFEDTADSRVRGRDCYIVELPNPTVGQYAWVRLWIDKEHGSIWQIDGHGADGKLKKRLSITSLKRLSNGMWIFKQMKIEVYHPQNPDLIISRNYLEIDDLHIRRQKQKTAL